MKTLLTTVLAVLAAALAAGCATIETSRAVEPARTAAAASTAPVYTGPKAPVSVGSFDNRSSFGRGIFADAGDRLGSQSKTILVSHLQQTNRFNVLDRENMAEARQEAALRQTAQAIKGAEFLVTGAVSEFGRREVGDRALFGLLGRGKTQVAYAKVTLNIVNPLTSEVVYSVQGGGEYTLSEREVLGFGSTASYDATLNGKVLDLAIREAVDRLVAGLDSGAFKSARP
jgi:curli biogenesis system outer membrane secretion channel CsgG